MPLITSSYRAPFGLRGGHRATIYPTLFRRVPQIRYERERLELPDGDFLDLDWSRHRSEKLAIIGHGLEGDSQAKYIRGMSAALARRGWDTLAWNCRGCSGEPNRLLRSYHSGVSEDLGHVVRHAVERYEKLALVGFSLGGNIVLKYLGEEGSSLHPAVKAAVAFSVPCDLTSSSLRLGDPDNRLYMKRFMDGLKEKVIEKKQKFPDEVNLEGLEGVRTFADFDDRFTAPFNGFQDARDYWKRASSLPHLSSISTPTLMVQALDDPFLAKPCFPRAIARESSSLSLEISKQGGHVGFASRGKEFWSERRAAQFLSEHLGER